MAQLRIFRNCDVVFEILRCVGTLALASQSKFSGSVIQLSKPGKYCTARHLCSPIFMSLVLECDASQYRVGAERSHSIDGHD